MDIMQAMKARHSVRQYEEKPLSAEQIAALEEEIELCNKESGLHIQLIKNEPRAFGSFMAHYGSFKGVTNYFALIGKKDDPDLDEKCGYYGERLVLLAQQLGLNTCWVALTYKKIPEVMDIAPDEKLVIVISLGYGATQGVPHRSKPLAALGAYEGEAPAWFQNGMQAALLAPTAVNQQKFFLSGKGGSVSTSVKAGPCNMIDLGIVKYHFELGAGKENFSWS